MHPVGRFYFKLFFCIMEVFVNCMSVLKWSKWNIDTMNKRSWMVLESICKEIIWISQIYWKFWTIVSKLSVHPLELKWMTRVQRKSPFLLSACLAWGCVCEGDSPARAVICPKAGIGATTVGPASWGWGRGGGSRNMEHMRCSGCHRSALCTNNVSK